MKKVKSKVWKEAEEAGKFKGVMSVGEFLRRCDEVEAEEKRLAELDEEKKH